jgi:hypothetical protein
MSLGLAVLVVGLSLIAFGAWATGQVVPIIAAHLAHMQAMALDRKAKELDLERRRVTVEERRVAVEERMHERPKEVPPMPRDLEGRCHTWEDEWANEAERKTITDLWNVYQDWDEVRQRLTPINAMASDPDTIAAPRDGLLQ